ncbi:GNAT family N-acetyltransferase [Paraclostridium ghonii]|uniref:GNAT family N-acetyltransferase n=1 Tax=Paraclostridium ghonii TaxID=29358 RepID=UPI0035251760
MRENIKIQQADIDDINYLLDIISKIDKKRDNMIIYDDFRLTHSKNSLEEVLSGKNENEAIIVAKDNEKIIGILNLLFSPPDYIFFVDKFVYIKYLYVDQDKLKTLEDREYISKELFDYAMNISKSNGFKYICGDVLTGDNELESLFKTNEMKDYRSRFCKNLNKI